LSVRPEHTAAGVRRDPVRVVVVDDHPIVRRGLVEAIGDEPGLVVCAEAATALEALAAIAAQRPHVAIVDLSLGHDSGLDLVSTIAKAHPAVRVLVLSGHDERIYADRALKAGALGYVMKDHPGDTLIAAIRRVACGKTYVSPETAERILSTLGTSRQDSVERSPLDRLSNRERHVLTLIGNGLTTREIAAQLALSGKTIETHCANIKAKLGLRHARDLTRAAVAWVAGTPIDGERPGRPRD
jgi:DNA-binding NarL/FixJ family response regulator